MHRSHIFSVPHQRPRYCSECPMSNGLCCHAEGLPPSRPPQLAARGAGRTTYAAARARLTAAISRSSSLDSSPSCPLVGGAPCSLNEGPLCCAAGSPEADSDRSTREEATEGCPEAPCLFLRLLGDMRTTPQHPPGRQGGAFILHQTRNFPPRRTLLPSLAEPFE